MYLFQLQMLTSFFYFLIEDAVAPHHSAPEQSLEPDGMSNFAYSRTVMLSQIVRV